MKTDLREEKGKEIAMRNDLKRVNVKRYEVRSMNRKIAYDVVSTEQGWVCTCPDHKFRKVICKHIFAVEFSIKLREEVRKRNSIIIKPVAVSECLFCHGSSFKKFGIRRNKSGDIQRYICSECNKTFSVNLGFEKMKSNPQTITSALQLYFTGESLRNVQKFLRLQGVDVSHKTVYMWIKKYTKLMQSYLDKITPQVGDIWRADEVWIKVRGDTKYLFALMDDETRFWIAQEVADSKFKHDARNLFRMGKEVAKTKPRVMITDGLPAYHDAFIKEFWDNTKLKPIHIRHIAIHGDKNNNKMERLNGEFRDREKVMRGLKKNDSVVIDGYQLYHNYIRPHMSLDGKTPAEACGIDIQGDNKWITLIQNASGNKGVRYDFQKVL